jgi:hypothetical protein
LSYTLVIFDPHTHPEDDFSRFDQLGQLILAEKPRNIVVGGDLGRVDSMSRHGDKPVVTFREDIASMNEAARRIFSPLREWNNKRRESRHRPHPMRAVWLEGNHEERARRVAKEDPHGFASLVDWDDPFGFSHWWDERYEYGEYANVDGVLYTHVPRNIMGRPMAHSTAAKHAESHLIFGHSHSLQVVNVPLHGTDNGVKTIMSAPAFMPHQNKEPYASRLTTGWSYGLLRVRPSGSPRIPPSYDYLNMVDLERMYG